MCSKQACFYRRIGLHLRYIDLPLVFSSSFVLLLPCSDTEADSFILLVRQAHIEKALAFLLHHFEHHYHTIYSEYMNGKTHIRSQSTETHVHLERLLRNRPHGDISTQCDKAMVRQYKELCPDDVYEGVVA